MINHRLISAITVLFCCLLTVANARAQTKSITYEQYYQIFERADSAIHNYITYSSFLMPDDEDMNKGAIQKFRSLFTEKAQIDDWLGGLIILKCDSSLKGKIPVRCNPTMYLGRLQSFFFKDESSLKLTVENIDADLENINNRNSIAFLLKIKVEGKTNDSLTINRKRYKGIAFDTSYRMKMLLKIDSDFNLKIDSIQAMDTTFNKRTPVTAIKKICKRKILEIGYNVGYCSIACHARNEIYSYDSYIKDRSGFSPPRTSAGFYQFVSLDVAGLIKPLNRLRLTGERGFSIKTLVCLSSQSFSIFQDYFRVEYKSKDDYGKIFRQLIKQHDPDIPIQEAVKNYSVTMPLLASVRRHLSDKVDGYIDVGPVFDVNRFKCNTSGGNSFDYGAVYAYDVTGNNTNGNHYSGNAVYDNNAVPSSRDLFLNYDDPNFNLIGYENRGFHIGRNIEYSSATTLYSVGLGATCQIGVSYQIKGILFNFNTIYLYKRAFLPEKDAKYLVDYNRYYSVLNTVRNIDQSLFAIGVHISYIK